MSKYVVQVERIARQSIDIYVDADNDEEAEELAMIEAQKVGAEFDGSTPNYDFEVTSVDDEVDDDEVEPLDEDGDPQDPFVTHVLNDLKKQAKEEGE